MYTVCLILLTITPIFSYTIPWKESDEFQKKEVEAHENSVHMHVGKIPKRGETVNAVAVDITTFRDLFKDDRLFGGPSFNKILADPQREGDNSITESETKRHKDNLNFKDALTMLALWHLAQNFNQYQVQDENTGMLGEKDSAVFTNMQDNNLSD